MSWQLLARKDFEDAIRSRVIWAAIGIFMLLVIILAVAANASGVEDLDPVDLYPGFAQLGAMFLIPIIAIMSGYRSIVEERESGSMRVLFGLSYSRSEIFLGKYASRLGVVSTLTLVPTASVLVVGLLLFGTIPLGRSAGFLVITVLLGVAFTAIAVSVSAMTGSRYRALGGAVGSYVLFFLFWHPVVAAIHYLVNGEFVGLQAPNWYLFLLRLNPLMVYTETISSFSDTAVSMFFNWSFYVEDIPQEAVIENPRLLMLPNRVVGDIPFYLSDWFAPVTMLVWIVLPPLVGYRLLERADLG